MKLRVNGAEQDFPSGTTLLSITDTLRVPASGVAVAVDGAVVPRASWPTAVPDEGANVEILTAVQGG